MSLYMLPLDLAKATISIIVTHDDTPVRGNVMVSGDDDADRAAEDEIIARVENGDVWAWCVVQIVASLGGFEGRSPSLGCSSYADETDFVEAGDYFDDMKGEAIAALQSAIVNAGARECGTIVDPDERRYIWAVTIDASADLVGDGFNVANQITGEDAGGELSTLGRIVDYLSPEHCRVRIIAAPDRRLVLAEQGCASEQIEMDPEIAIRCYTAADLERMATISSGQAHDLKCEREVFGVPTRWLLSRCTLADGETHRIYVEQCRDGVWTEIDKYDPY